MTTATSLPYTGNEAADRLLASDPLALLIGFALDQQVTVQKAFSGPWELRQRLGYLDAARIAAIDPAELDRVFRERPALHRFPGSMAGKVQALCAAIAREYGGDAGRIWREAAPYLDIRIVAAPDKYFHAESWWTSREGKKIWLLEWAKVVTSPFGL